MTNQEFLESITQEGEEWRDVIGYEGLYAVSSYGRVVSYEKKIPHIKTFRVRPPRIMHQTPIPKSKHLYVSLKDINGAYQKKYVHRLVAQVFIPNPNNYPEIDHKDCNPQNNKVCNLHWCTRSMNLSNPLTKETRFKLIVEKGIAIRPKPVVAICNGKKPLTFLSLKKAQKAGHYMYLIKRSIKTGEMYHGYTWSYHTSSEASNQ